MQHMLAAEPALRERPKVKVERARVAYTTEPIPALAGGQGD